MVYEKITLIIKNKPDSYEEFDGTYSVEYLNCSYKLTNEHMVVLAEHKDNVIGEIIPIKAIKNFKLDGGNPKNGEG